MQYVTLKKEKLNEFVAQLAKLQKVIGIDMLEAALKVKFKNNALKASLDLVGRIEVKKEV